MATTVYDITADFSDQDIYTDVLLTDAVDAGVPITDVSCRSQSNPNKVLFESATPLSAPDKTTLDGVVAAYDPADGIHGDFPDDTFRILDNVDPTKEMAFEISGVTTGTVRTLTMPDASITPDDVSGSRPPDTHAASHSDGGSDEVTIENLATSGTIGQVPTSDGAGGLTMDTPSGSGNVTSPGGETAARITKFTSPNNIDETAVTEAQLNTLVGGGSADSEHTHADFADDAFRIQDNTDPTKEIAFQVSGVTTGTVRTITVPDASITVDDAGDSRPPNVHASSHSDGGSDEVTIENLATAGSNGQVPTSDGAGGLTMETPGGGGSSFPIYMLPAVDLEGSLDSGTDWFLNVLAPLDADPDNDAIKVRSHNNTVDEGWGYTIAVPATATNMTIKIRSRPSATTGVSVTDVVPLIYFREEPDGGSGIGAWAQGLSASAMDSISFPALADHYVYFSQTETLAAWGVTADSDWRFQIFNDSSASSIVLFWLVRYVEVSFS